MFGENLADLDELLLRCRDEQAKTYIAEAIACYRAGAFRACIVTTWIAVVFDIIHKLRELELSEDKQAREKLQKLEEIQRRNDVRASLEFEREVLELARDTFEFLSALEYDDLKRLFDDRNRCAHPSMQSGHEPYQPPGELARYHLRNAVFYLLQRPPVQGKAALERIWAEIGSEYFPREIGKAIEHFKHSPLVRAREPLIRDVIVGLTKSLLREQRPPMERTRQFTALSAVLHMYVAMGEKTLRENLPKIVQRLDDGEWANVIEYMRRIPIGWEAVGESGRIKAHTFMATSLPKEVACAIGNALHIADLRETALRRISELSTNNLAEQIHVEPLHEYTEVAVQRFAAARSFDEGNRLAQLLIFPLIPVLASKDVREVVKVFLQNDQLYKSSGTIDVIGELFRQKRRDAEGLRELWVEVYNDFRIVNWRRGGMTIGRGRLYEGHPLMNMIEETFPEVLRSEA